MPGPTRPAWVPLALILGAAVWTQAPALRLPFFADDYLFLDQARFRSLAAVLRSRDPIGNFVRPVGRQLWFWVISRLGESAAIGHTLNLAAFLGIITLMFVVARRVAGPRAAAIAASLVALHYVADVPLRWVSGSQDLLATLGALGALALFLAGRRALSALALALALLSKETVALTPLIAALAARRRDEPWGASLRRAWTLGAVTVAWALLRLAMLRHGSAAGLGVSLGAVPATFVHLVQVVAGAEWRRDDPARLLRTLPPLIALALALLAVAWSGSAPMRAAPARGGKGRGAREPVRHRAPDRPASLAAARRDAGDPVRVGLAWATAGAIPVIAVASIWSAYYFLFAVCGAALAIGAALRRSSTAAALLAVALLGWSSEGARRVQEFETGSGAWTIQSHVNRYYVERALIPIRAYLKDLKRQLPSLPHGSTLYFSRVPGFISWQAADGPLVRWAYRDSSLRSYFASQFGLYPPRGTYFIFEMQNDSLTNITAKPGMLRSLAISELLDEKIDLARNTLHVDIGRLPEEQLGANYLLGWIDLFSGDTVQAYARLRAAGMSTLGPPTPEIAEARARLAQRDTVGAVTLLIEGSRKHVLDPAAHGALADLLFAIDPNNPNPPAEAFAARVLSPRDPAVWWRWSVMQSSTLRPQPALKSFRQFYALASPRTRADPRVARMLDYLNRSQPGGEIVQTWLRRGGKVKD